MGWGLRYESAAEFNKMLSGTSTYEVIIQSPRAPAISLLDSQNASFDPTVLG
jgi:hypothetical protein